VAAPNSGTGANRNVPARKYAIRNPRTGVWLATRVEVARTVWARGRGLLGRRGLTPGEGLFIPSCNSIHSFFMAFRFDALFIDKQWRLVHAIDAMSPFRISPIVWRADGVVELPAGTIQQSGTRIGDNLEPVALDEA